MSSARVAWKADLNGTPLESIFSQPVTVKLNRVTGVIVTGPSRATPSLLTDSLTDVNLPSSDVRRRLLPIVAHVHWFCVQKSQLAFSQMSPG